MSCLTFLRIFWHLILEPASLQRSTASVVHTCLRLMSAESIPHMLMVWAVPTIPSLSCHGWLISWLMIAACQLVARIKFARDFDGASSSALSFPHPNLWSGGDHCLSTPINVLISGCIVVGSLNQQPPKNYDQPNKPFPRIRGTQDSWWSTRRSHFQDSKACSWS